MNTRYFETNYALLQNFYRNFNSKSDSKKYSMGPKGEMIRQAAQAISHSFGILKKLVSMILGKRFRRKGALRLTMKCYDTHHQCDHIRPNNTILGYFFGVWEPFSFSISRFLAKLFRLGQFFLIIKFVTLKNHQHFNFRLPI